MLMSPVPSGFIETFALDADVIALPFVSRSPESCGDVSSAMLSAASTHAEPLYLRYSLEAGAVIVTSDKPASEPAEAALFTHAEPL